MILAIVKTVSNNSKHLKIVIRLGHGPGIFFLMDVIEIDNWGSNNLIDICMTIDVHIERFFFEILNLK